MSITVFPLGREIPGDWNHVERFPFSVVAPEAVEHVELALTLPGWHWSHNQGDTGGCVGHAIAMERAITNRAQAVAAGDKRAVRYDPIDVWRQAKAIDEWPQTKPGDNNGTSVRAGYQVTLNRGLCSVSTMRLVKQPDDFELPTPVSEKAPDPAAGVAAYRWAITVDEIRTAISMHLPVALGINWYSAFDTPTQKGKDWFVPDGSKQLGRVRGGHAIPIYGASDERQAFKLKNSWGKAYPLVWFPYTTLERLLNEKGEAALVTDK